MKKTACLALLLMMCASPAYALCGPVLAVVLPVSFGLYNANAAGNTNANGTVTLTCTVLIFALPDFTISLSKGNYGNYTNRKMLGLGQYLNYNLYTTAGYNAVWGDGTGGSVTQTHNSDSSTTLTYTIYGSIPKSQYPSLGVYTDGVTVTISY